MRGLPTGDAHPPRLPLGLLRVPLNPFIYTTPKYFLAYKVDAVVRFKKC